ncbi:MAG: NUDIX domain-containing protein [Candidatus Staskawiczbacteria bacterium]|nr:NUDIX domain-containing protein [Candidatus Staskawiczbacteria bacterium]
MPKEKSAGAVVYRIKDNVPHYLLLHYHSGHWEFAKGHIEEGESNEDTVKREIEEETGIKDLKIIPGFKEYVKYFFRKSYGLSGEAKKKAPWVFKLVVFYLAQTNTEDVVISKEHTGFIWLPFGDAVKKLTYKNAKNILTKAHNYLLLKLGQANDRLVLK